MYRKLSKEEVDALLRRGCSAIDWDQIEVHTSFKPECLENVKFSGKIRIGIQEKVHNLEGGIEYRSGITNAVLHNVEIGNNVCIRNVMNYIANYSIGDEVLIDNVSRIVCEGESTFGNGVMVSVLNEVGGRDVPMFAGLSAHLAYMMAMYRYRPVLIEKIESLVKKHAELYKSDMGTICYGSRIFNTQLIKNLYIGEYSLIDGASSLENGTLDSTKSDPIFIGSNVMAKDFIACSGARISDGAVLLHTFVGQATHLSHLFSSHDSLFFANCNLENGESAAIFGGPYTVSMHKSSLLIAGIFSFLNAGSGSNQSNHMYKLGPIHQGIVERGSKTTSDSYMLWPARIGVFSLVMGRHVSHPDTSRMPFSYLIENKNRSYLAPGVNLKSVGTIRDAQKWPKRDRRRDPNKLDKVNFNLLSPYTVGRMIEGIEVLDLLERTSGFTADCYTYQSMIIEPKALRKGRYYYRLAIDKFMGNSLISRIKSAQEIKSIEQLREVLAPSTESGNGEWIDLSGLILPKKDIVDFITDIEEDRITSISEINDFFEREYSNYYQMEWTWVVEQFKKWYNKPVDELTATDICLLVNKWKNSVRTIDEMLYDDAKKEFSLQAKTGFGVDGGDMRKESDFEAVRGDFEKDPFVLMINEHIATKMALGDSVIAMMEKIK